MKDFNVLEHCNRIGPGYGAWKVWDAANPPPAGVYIVWDPYFADAIERVWSYREHVGWHMGDRWGDKKGCLYWYNDGNWRTERPPCYYRPMPRFPAKDQVLKSCRLAAKDVTL